LDEKIKAAHERLNQAIRELEEASGFKIVNIDVDEEGRTYITADFDNMTEAEHYAIRLGAKKAN
jgi:hypothetical protein